MTTVDSQILRSESDAEDLRRRVYRYFAHQGDTNQVVGVVKTGKNQWLVRITAEAANKYHNVMDLMTGS